MAVEEQDLPDDLEETSDQPEESALEQATTQTGAIPPSPVPKPLRKDKTASAADKNPDLNGPQPGLVQQYMRQLVDNKKAIEDAQAQGKQEAAPLAQGAAALSAANNPVAQGQTTALLNLLQQGENARGIAGGTAGHSYTNPASQAVYDKLQQQATEQQQSNNALQAHLQQQYQQAKNEPLNTLQQGVAAEKQGAELAMDPSKVEEAQAQIATMNATAQKLGLANTLAQKPVDAAAAQVYAAASGGKVPASAFIGKPYQEAELLAKSAQEAGAHAASIQKVKAGQDYKTEVQSNKDVQGAVDKFNADPAVKQAVVDKATVANLSDLVKATDNEVAQGGAQILKVRELMGSPRGVASVMDRLGMQSYSGQFVSLLNKKLNGTLSPEEAKDLNNLNDMTLQRSENTLDQRAKQYAHSKATDKVSEDDLYQRMRGKPLNAPQASAKSSTPSISPEDQQALDWANSNPSDPRAKQIKQRLGQ